MQAPPLPLADVKLAVHLLKWDLWQGAPLSVLHPAWVALDRAAEESYRLVPHVESLGRSLSSLTSALRRVDSSAQYLAALGLAPWGRGRLGLHYHVLAVTAEPLTEGTVTYPGGRLSTRPLRAWPDVRAMLNYMLNWDTQGGQWLPQGARRVRRSGLFADLAREGKSC